MTDLERKAVLLHHLTMVRAAADSAMLSICMADQLGTQARQPQLEVAGAGSADRILKLNGKPANALPPSPASQLAGMAEQFAQKYQGEMAKLFGNVEALKGLVGGNG